MKDWKRWLKGIYNTEGTSPQLLVTGSAKLDTYRKVGDSLAGRYFQYRLHPLDIKEALQYWQADKNEIFQRLWQCSGFPEPFLKGNATYYKRWQKSHLDIILRQDLIDMYSVSDIQAIETLVLLLKRRVGCTISYANLARDLERDTKTIKRWLQLLENLYVIFRITPYHKNVARSLLIDFLISIDDQATHLIDVKWADGNLTPSFKHFQKYFKKIHKVQLVKELPRNKTYPDGTEVRSLIDWLADINLAKNNEE